jgi:hypothetical protein
MELYEATEEVLAFAGNRDTRAFRVFNSVHERHGYRAVHLYAVLTVFRAIPL